MSRKKKGNSPVYRQHAIFPQMEPLPKKLKNPPKDDPEVQARLAKFIADEDWLHAYRLYLTKFFTKGKAANLVGVGSIEFGEQIRKYKASLKPNYDPQLYVRLAEFVPDSDWKHIYYLYVDKVFSRKKASKYLEIGTLEFVEQVRIYEAYLKRIGRWN